MHFAIVEGHAEIWALSMGSKVSGIVDGSMRRSDFAATARARGGASGVGADIGAAAAHWTGIDGGVNLGCGRRSVGSRNGP